MNHFVSKKEIILKMNFLLKENCKCAFIYVLVILFEFLTMYIVRLKDRNYNIYQHESKSSYQKKLLILSKIEK